LSSSSSSSSDITSASRCGSLRCASTAPMSAAAAADAAAVSVLPAGVPLLPWACSCPDPAFLPLRCRCGGCGYPTSLHTCRVGMPVGVMVLVLCAVVCRGLPPGWQRHVREECCVLAGLARAQCAGVPRRQRCPHLVPAGQQASVQVVAWQVCLHCWVGGLASWVHPLLPPTCLTALASQTRCAAQLSVCRRA
jgi:hypothetical protein